MSDADTGSRLKAPGARLRQLRLARGWTLGDLSGRTGLPASTLSKIENGKMSLSYDKLTRISDGLEIDAAEVFEAREAPPRQALPLGRRSITRLGEGGAIETAAYSHVYHSVDLLNKQFVPIVGEIKHRRIEDAELIRHEGEEYTYVLEGTVEFHSELYAPVILRTGESIYFDSSMGHTYLAVGDERCRVLSICAGPGAESLGLKDHESSHARPGSVEPPVEPPKASKSKPRGKAGKPGSRGSAAARTR